MICACYNTEQGILARCVVLVLNPTIIGFTQNWRRTPILHVIYKV